MDMSLNRFDTILLDDCDIDAVSNAICNYFFKDFFNQRNTHLFVQCMTDDGAKDCVIHICDRFDELMRKTAFVLGGSLLKDFYRTVHGVLRTSFAITSARSKSTGALCVTSCMRILGMGYVFITCLFMDEDSRKEVYESLYGLSLFVSHYLSRYNIYAGELAGKIEGAKITNIDKTTHVAIIKRVKSYLQNSALG